MNSISENEFAKIFDSIGFIVERTVDGVIIIEKKTNLVLVKTKETEPDAYINELINELKQKANEKVITTRFGSEVYTNKCHKLVFEEYNDLIKKYKL